MNKEQRKELCGRLHNIKGAEHIGDETCAMTPHLFSWRKTGVGSLGGV